MAIASTGAGDVLFDFLVALSIDFLVLWLFCGFLVVDFLILILNCLFLILGLQVLFWSYWSNLIVYLFVKLIIDLIAFCGFKLAIWSCFWYWWLFWFFYFWAFFSKIFRLKMAMFSVLCGFVLVIVWLFGLFCGWFVGLLVCLFIWLIIWLIIWFWS